MKIGNQELGDQESKLVNKIISEFLNSKHEVVEGSPPEQGRSKSGKQFRLNVDDKRYVSIKLEYDSPENIRWELLNSEMRQLLQLPHYRVVKKKMVF